MSATANPDDANKLTVTLSEDRSKIYVVFPRKPNRKFTTRLTENGFKPTRFEGRPAFVIAFSDDNWVKAWEFKEWFEKPKVDQELLRIDDPEVLKRPGGEKIRAKLAWETKGADKLIESFTGDFNDPMARDLVFSKVNVLLRKMGILDLYVLADNDSFFDPEGNVWFRRKRPIIVDPQGDPRGAGDVGMSYPEAREVFGRYTKTINLMEVVQAGLELLHNTYRQPFWESKRFKSASRESVLYALKAAKQQKHQVSAHEHRRLIDHLLDLKNRIDPPQNQVPQSMPTNTEDKLTEAEILISAFVGLHNRKVSPQRIRHLIDTLQNAVQLGKIGATVTPKDQLTALRYIQKKLIGWWNDSLSDQPDSFLALVRVNPQKLRQFKKLVTKIDHQPLDKPEDGSLPVLKGLPAYVIPPPKVRGEAAPVIFSADKPPANHDHTFTFSEGWEKLWNNPVIGFSAMVYGQPKSGKSTLALDFAGYLARTGKGPVMYASIEEGIRGTITERIERLGAGNRDLFVTNNLPADLRGYRFVVIDSVSRGFVDIDLMRKLIGDWPEMSFLFIFHVTKDGLPRGKNDFAHEVDVLVEVKDGVANAVGRFGPGKMPVRFGPAKPSPKQLSLDLPNTHK